MAEIAGTGAAGGDSGEETLDIVNAVEFFTEVVGEARIGSQFGDGRRGGR